MTHFSSRPIDDPDLDPDIESENLAALGMHEIGDGDKEKNKEDEDDLEDVAVVAVVSNADDLDDVDDLRALEKLEKKLKEDEFGLGVSSDEEEI